MKLMNKIIILVLLQNKFDSGNKYIEQTRNGLQNYDEEKFDLFDNV